MRNWAPNGGKKLNNPEFLIPFLLCSSTSSTIIFMMSSLSRVVGRKVYKGVDSIFPVAFIFPKDITWLSHSNGYHLAVRKIHIFFSQQVWLSAAADRHSSWTQLLERWTHKTSRLYSKQTFLNPSGSVFSPNHIRSQRQ